MRQELKTTPINLMRLRDHTIGALAVAFVASLATLLLSVMAKVGPRIFTHITVGMAVVTILAIAASAFMLAVLIFKTKG